MSAASAGSGYFVSPTDGPGPGILLLHSFWGLNRAVKDTANSLSDAGFTVLAPDLTEEEEYVDPDQAMNALSAADMNVLASLVQSSVGILRKAQVDSGAPIAVVGYGSGASWALWLSARFVDEIAAVVTYYGAQAIPMGTSNASYLCHWAEHDSLVSDLEVAELGLSLQMANRPFTFEHHADTSSGFAESGRPEHDPKSERMAWTTTLDFLKTHLHE